VNIVNCYNKNNDYHIDFRQLLEEDEFAEYEEKLRSRNISFTDIAKEPSSVNEIISRTVHNYVINPDELKYIILDKTVILDVSSDSLIKLKNAIREYAVHFKNMIIIEQGGDPVGDLKRESGNGRNFYLFTESDRNKLISDVLDKIIEIEDNPGDKIANKSSFNISKIDDRKEEKGNAAKSKADKIKAKTAVEEDKESEPEHLQESLQEEFENKKEKKEKLTEKIVKGIKGKTEKKETEKKKSEKQQKEEASEDINNENETVKVPNLHSNPDLLKHLQPIDMEARIETRINRQEELSVKEMLRRGNSPGKDKNIISNSVDDSRVNRFTEERLNQAVKMTHLLERKKSWNTINNIIIIRGLYGNISATFLSLVIANTLQSNNASIAYINDSHHDFLYTVQNYGIKKSGNFYVRDNIVFLENFMAIPDVNFYIIDSKEAYYNKKEALLENGFKPYYLVVANGDAKGISFLKNEEGMLKANGIDEYRMIVKDVNTEMYNLLYKELNPDKIIEYKHIDNGPFDSLAKNSSIANDLYRIFEEIDENNRGEQISALEVQELEEDLEI
jgi:hypothetical protein